MNWKFKHAGWTCVLFTRNAVRTCAMLAQKNDLCVCSGNLANPRKPSMLHNMYYCHNMNRVNKESKRCRSSDASESVKPLQAQRNNFVQTIILFRPISMLVLTNHHAPSVTILMTTNHSSRMHNIDQSACAFSNFLTDHQSQFENAYIDQSWCRLSYYLVDHQITIRECIILTNHHAPLVTKLWPPIKMP